MVNSVVWLLLLKLQLVVWMMDHPINKISRSTAQNKSLVEIAKRVNRLLVKTWCVKIYKSKCKSKGKVLEDKISDSNSEQGEDDDVTIGVSNCVADGQGSKWEELEEENDAEVPLADAIPILDSESNSDLTMALMEAQRDTEPVSIIPFIQDSNVDAEALVAGAIPISDSELTSACEGVDRVLSEVSASEAAIVSAPVSASAPAPAPDSDSDLVPAPAPALVPAPVSGLAVAAPAPDPVCDEAIASL